MVTYAVTTNQLQFQVEVGQAVEKAWPRIAHEIRERLRAGTSLSDLVVFLRFKEPPPKGTAEVSVVLRDEVEELIGIPPSIEPRFTEPLPPGKMWCVALIGAFLSFTKLTVETR